jgi:hypothetical protein
MLLNSSLTNGAYPVPDTVPARTPRPRPQTPPSVPTRVSYAVPQSVPAAADDVHVQWKGNEGVIVTFTDKKSGEVVWQIPAEQVLSVARYIRRVLDEQKTSKSGT